jgi:uncharacterized protein (TIGR02001 family)
MNRKSPWIAVAVLASALAGFAQAEVSSTITATSNYDFRGQTQTAGDPALQASLDWSAASSGLYATIWASNVDFGAESDIEIDAIGGYKFSINDDLALDLGFVAYLYQPDDDDVDYLEIYAGLSYRDFASKFYYSDDYFNTGESAWYVDTSYSFPLPNDFGIALHAGYNGGDYWDGAGGEFFDYSIGVTKELGNFSLALKWIDGSDYEPGDIDRDLPFSSKAKVVFSVATTLPWGKE